jgi:hypothetical protein
MDEEFNKIKDHDKLNQVIVKTVQMNVSDQKYKGFEEKF